MEPKAAEGSDVPDPNLPNIGAGLDTPNPPAPAELAPKLNPPPRPPAGGPGGLVNPLTAPEDPKLNPSELDFSGKLGLAKKLKAVPASALGGAANPPKPPEALFFYPSAPPSPPLLLAFLMTRPFIWSAEAAWNLPASSLSTSWSQFS